MYAFLFPGSDVSKGLNVGPEVPAERIWVEFLIPAKSKRGREEGDGTENVINCRKLS